MKTIEKKPGKLGTSGSSTSTASPARPVLKSFHDNILETAKLPIQEVLWVNNKGMQKTSQQVVGDKVLLRQQPAAPLVQPEVLLLTDQTLEQFQSPDKYIKCLAMSGFAMEDFTNDIKDGMLDIDYKYIIIHLGTLQIAQYSHKYVQSIVTDIITVMSEISPNTLVMLLGLVLQPLDHHRSKNLCNSYTKSYITVTEELRKNKGWNCVALNMFNEFVDVQGEIVQVQERFYDGLFLTLVGIKVLRAAWL